MVTMPTTTVTAGFEPSAVSVLNEMCLQKMSRKNDLMCTETKKKYFNQLIDDKATNKKPIFLSDWL